MKVSVIVLTYNQELTIGRTLDSILAQQTDFPFEIIIGEDASPSDNTRAICQSYADKYANIKLLDKAPNKGLLRNYSDCLKECKGDYIACCAGDDWWSEPKKIQIQVEFLEQNIDYGVIHTDMDMFDIASNKLQKAMGDRCPPEGYVHEALYRACFVYAPTVMIRRELMRFVDFDKFIALGFKMEDYPMWFELSRHTKFHHLNISTVTYQVSSISLSHSPDIDSRIIFLDATKAIQDYYYEFYRPKLKIQLSVTQSRMYYMECLKYGAYRRSFNFVSGLGLPWPVLMFLSTYLGAFFCGIYLKIFRK